MSANFLDDAREFNAEDWTCLWWDRVLTLTLAYIHSIQSEGFHLLLLEIK